MRLPVVLSALLISSGTWAACTASDMSLKKPKVVQTRIGSLRVVGEVISKCSEPARLFLTLVARAKDGGVVAVEKAWPTGQTIAPNGSLPFDELVMPAEKADTVDPVISVER